MPTLLKVNASPRGEMSISRKMGERYVHRWLAAHPGGTIVERDLMRTPIPYMDVDWIAGVYAPPAVPRTPQMKAALGVSETLISELVQADQVLIRTPMYNFSVPAVLKSWIDYLVRPGFTFKLAPGWPGLLADKPTRILIMPSTPDEGCFRMAPSLKSNALLVRVLHPPVVLKMANGPCVASSRRAHGWLRLVSRRNGLEEERLRCPT
jgi:FMN-dependent NADH-azoreductase